MVGGGGGETRVPRAAVWLGRAHVPFFQISYYSLAIILVSASSSYALRGHRLGYNLG